MAVAVWVGWVMSFSLKAAVFFFWPGLSQPIGRDQPGTNPIAHLFGRCVNVCFRHMRAKTDMKHARLRMMTMK
jgi:hypothetical protein